MDGVYPLDVEHVAVAYEQTLHLSRLVDDLRLLTQAEAGRLPLVIKPTSPASLVTQTIARFEPLAQDAGIALASEVASDLPMIQVDHARLFQVFDNLLINALRHSAADGRICMHALLHSDAVRFIVSNSGEIDAETAAHLFDRFWRADGARSRDAGGSGLGLAISRQIVLLHGGSIDVESSDGETRFIIDLPVSTK